MLLILRGHALQMLSRLQAPRTKHLFLINPIILIHLPLREILLGEPQRNLLLGRLHAIGAVADIASDVLDELIVSLAQQREMSVRMDEGTYDGEVTADGARLGSERVGCAEELTAGFDDFFAFPDHGAYGAAGHVCATLAGSSASRELGRMYS